MSLKSRLIKKIYESNEISIKEKISIIKELKDLPGVIIENILLEFPMGLAQKLNPQKLAMMKSKWNLIVDKMVKSGKPKEQAEIIANRMLGVH